MDFMPIEEKFFLEMAVLDETQFLNVDMILLEWCVAGLCLVGATDT